MLLCHIRRKVSQSSELHAQPPAANLYRLIRTRAFVSWKMRDACMHLAFVSVAWTSLLFLTTGLLSHKKKKLRTLVMITQYRQMAGVKWNGQRIRIGDLRKARILKSMP